MFDEGIASKQLGDRLQVDDVAVYVARSLAGGEGAEAVAALAVAADSSPATEPEVVPPGGEPEVTPPLSSTEVDPPGNPTSS
jgi:hypothetical protein